jgi:alkyl hydroperoxide reductase subunit F
VTGLTYKDRVSGEMHQVALAGIFVQIGLLPNTQWLKGTVELSSRGEIIVDDHGRTSVPGVFAAGDVTTVPTSRSSSRWARAPRRRCRPSIT